jgi:hypothetical protein
MPGFEDEDDLRPRRAHRDDDIDDVDDRRGSGGQYAPHRGVLILVFGILGMMMCGAFGIAAWMMGKGDMKEINAGRMDPEGRSLTQVGYILGIVGMVIFCLQLLFIVAYIILGVVFFAAAAGK